MATSSVIGHSGNLLAEAHVQQWTSTSARADEDDDLAFVRLRQPQSCVTAAADLESGSNQLQLLRFDLGRASAAFKGFVWVPCEPGPK